MNLESIQFDVKERVGWITLNRPDVLNAQNDLLRSELISVLQKIKEDDNIQVAVLTGAGEKAFSAGADVSEFLNWSLIDVIKMREAIKRHYDMIREILKPFIAMVNGLALGGGCELALSCDIIIATDKARFGQPEIKVGVIPGGGGTQILPRLVGEKKAKEMIFTGDLISADDALRMGLVNKVVPDNKLKTTVEELTEKLKAMSPAILKFAKMSINQSLEMPLKAGLCSEGEAFAMCFGTKDQKEGVNAFLEKRHPVYIGR